MSKFLLDRFTWLFTTSISCPAARSLIGAVLEETGHDGIVLILCSKVNRGHDGLGICQGIVFNAKL